MKIAILAAVPLELKHLVRGWERVRSGGAHVSLWRRETDGDTVVAACAGMGADAARRAFAAAEKDAPVDLVISVGLAGATEPSLHPGQVVVLSEVIDSRTGERFTLTKGKRRLRIATLPHVADAQEKKRLLATYGAVMVDMESATIARMAQQRGIPMCCIKAISDESTAVLPDINPYLRDGQLRLLPFLCSVALRPGSWRPLLNLGRNSGIAAKRLAEAIHIFLRDKDWARANRTGSLKVEP